MLLVCHVEFMPETPQIVRDCFRPGAVVFRIIAPDDHIPTVEESEQFATTHGGEIQDDAMLHVGEFHNGHFISFDGGWSAAVNENDHDVFFLGLDYLQEEEGRGRTLRFEPAMADESDVTIVCKFIRDLPELEFQLIPRSRRGSIPPRSAQSTP